MDDIFKESWRRLEINPENQGSKRHITKKCTEVAEPGDFGMDNQLPRLGYRGRYVAMCMAKDMSGVAQAFINALQPSLQQYTVSDENEIMRIPAQAPEVGDLVVYDDGDELTVAVGKIHHCHFESYCVDAPTGEERQAIAAENAVEWVTAVINEHVQFRNEFQCGRVISGSSWRTQHHDGGRLLKKTDEWTEYTWSGLVLHQSRIAD